MKLQPVVIAAFLLSGGATAETRELARDRRALAVDRAQQADDLNDLAHLTSLQRRFEAAAREGDERRISAIDVELRRYLVREHGESMRERAQDGREVRQDRRELREDRRQIADNRGDGAGPLRRRDDRRDRRDDRRDLRDDRRDLRDDRLPGDNYFALWRQLLFPIGLNC